jgi:hypothetical protein
VGCSASGRRRRRRSMKKLKEQYYLEITCANGIIILK